MMLLRAAPAGTEVYLLRRLSSMAFAPGAFVFPGGKVDERDSEDGHGWAGPPPEQLAPALGGSPAAAAALVRAAVRETFEECGVLLATPAPGEPAPDRAVLDEDQHALLTGSLSVGELLLHRPSKAD